jgi:hypothetical protein
MVSGKLQRAQNNTIPTRNGKKTHLVLVLN